MNTLKIIVVGFLSGLAGAYSFYSYQQEKAAGQPKGKSISGYKL
ncbi:MAG: hypothetical protein U5K54_27115 [Cytophagales bacterium]|nr:hypothetical protein [Cytophagales bacterium]